MKRFSLLTLLAVTGISANSPLQLRKSFWSLHDTATINIQFDLESFAKYYQKSSSQLLEMLLRNNIKNLDTRNAMDDSRDYQVRKNIVHACLAYWSKNQCYSFFPGKDKIAKRCLLIANANSRDIQNIDKKMFISWLSARAGRNDKRAQSAFKRQIKSRSISNGSSNQPLSITSSPIIERNNNE